MRLMMPSGLKSALPNNGNGAPRHASLSKDDASIFLHLDETICMHIKDNLHDCAVEAKNFFCHWEQVQVRGPVEQLVLSEALLYTATCQ